MKETAEDIISDHDRAGKFTSATLPKWVGDLILSLAREVRDWREQTAARDATDAKVVTRQRIGPKSETIERPVGDDTVVFKCGERFTEEIEVGFDFHEQRQGRYVLRVCSGGRPLLIRLSGGINNILVALEE